MNQKTNLSDKLGQKHGWWIDYYYDEDPITKRMVANQDKPYCKDFFEHGNKVLYQHYSYDEGLTREIIYLW